MVEERESAPSTPGSSPATAPAQPATANPGATRAPAGQQPAPGFPATAVHQPAQSASGATPAAAVPTAAASTPGADPTPASAQAPVEDQPAGVDAPAIPADPGFLERGGLRRRLRFLRKTRELAYRDLGGLVFEMHRLGQERRDLLEGKLATLGRIDREARGIENALHTNRGVTVLREAGVTACPRCAAIHGSEDRFCPACGFSMSSAERPIAANPVAAPVATTAQAPTTTPLPTTARPNPSPSPPVATAPAASPAQAPGAAAPAPAPQTAPAPATSRAPTPPPPAAAPPHQNGPVQPLAPAHQNGPKQPVAQPPAEVEEPTEIIEPPTRIVRPGEEPQAGKSNRA